MACASAILVVTNLYSAAALPASVKDVGAAECADAGKFNTKSSTHEMEGGHMLCKYPTDTDAKFPLVSFEHGDVAGGLLLRLTYKPYMEAIASSGFVICAPLMCSVPCRERQHIHQLNAIVAAKALAEKGTLPVRSDAAVGVVGHSTGGMTTLKCATKSEVSEHGIGAAVAYNGDGPAESLEKNDNVSFARIEPSLPMFLVTGSGDNIEPKGSTQSNQAAILKTNPKQPLLVAEIDGEGHLDSIDIPLVHPAPLKAVPYIIAFLGHTLTPSPQCTASYEKTMGTKLQSHSSKYYSNQLFGTGKSAMIV